MTVWACQAGKDVYVEKPCSHAVREGRAAVVAARKFDRIVQHGTQRRSWPEYHRLEAVVRSGVYGPLRVSRGIVYKLRLPIGVRPEAPVPAGLDFDLWLGPAAARPFHANLVHYNWHWFWDFGNGDVGNQGVHQMDLARWMIPGATLPRGVVSVGGRFGEPDQGETPNTLVSQFDYGPTQLVFEVRGLPTANHPGDAKNEGLVLHFDDGFVANFQFFRHGNAKGEPIPRVLPEPPRPAGGSHFGNFIAAIRTRDRTQLTADIVEGHYSSALCHLANVSYRLGTETSAGGPAALGQLCPEARATWAATEGHLAQCLGPRLAAARLRVGRNLTLDPAAETIPGDAQADAELSATYRKPFAFQN
jgi:predicted dehydrogenase